MVYWIFSLQARVIIEKFMKQEKNPQKWQAVCVEEKEGISGVPSISGAPVSQQKLCWGLRIQND